MFLHSFHLKIAVIAILFINLCGGYYTYSKCRNDNGGDKHVISRLEIMLKMLRLIRKNYVDMNNITSDDLLTAAMHGMEKKLDKHSSFFQPRDAKELKTVLSGKMGGIGITTVKKEDKVLVVHVNENSPAEKAGILPGDEITAIDGKDTQNQPYDDVTQQIRGDAGTYVKITIARHINDHDETQTFNIKRDVISFPSVSDARLLANTNCAYIKIYSFLDGMPEKLTENISALIKNTPQVDSLILDLRGNGGGLLTGAVDVCSIFLPEKQLVVSSQMMSNGTSSTTSEKKFFAKGGYKAPQSLKLAVLIDRNSASASEITAGCLQDLKRAVIVGEKSYGKGSVQALMELGQGNLLKLTVARYHTPDEKRIIDGVGITPDVECRVPYMQLHKIYRNMYTGQSNAVNDPQILAALNALNSSIP